MRLIPTTLLVCVTANYGYAQCLDQALANQVASNYALLFTDYSNATANRVLATNFIDQSDSVESLINNGTTCPFTLGGLFSSSRAAFETASSTQPNMPFKVLQTYYDCTHVRDPPTVFGTNLGGALNFEQVFVKWVIAFNPQEVQGIAILTTQLNLAIPGNIQTPFLIREVQAEFNSLAWSVDLGNFRGTPPEGCRQ